MKVYDAITICKQIPCGNIYIIFNESEHAFDNMIIKGDMARECPCGEAWFNSISKLITFCMRRSVWEGTTKEGIIKQLLGHQCPGYIPNKEHILSCPDAIARAVLEYSKSRDLVNE